ncbi:MAG: DUF433 domain-containing protein, partial [Thiobacillus sp.]|nr:DUF433 domain-containing protein [Thiobacillus sp.]
PPGLNCGCRTVEKERIMEWRDRIVSDPEILVGKPVIKGTRISVELIIGWLANGWTFEQLLESYPHITREDILAALAFAAEMMQEEQYIARHKAVA